MYDLSTSLGFAIGPLIGSSLQVALGGGIPPSPPSFPSHEPLKVLLASLVLASSLASSTLSTV